jgi:hypothetical protein
MGQRCWRFETDREITLVAAAADPEALARWPVGTRTPVDGDTIATLVQRSGRPARIDSYDNVAGPIAARVRAVGVRAAVAVPIIVDGRVWGLAGGGFPATRPETFRVCPKRGRCQWWNSRAPISPPNGCWFWAACCAGAPGVAVIWALPGLCCTLASAAAIGASPMAAADAAMASGAT